MALQEESADEAESAAMTLRALLSLVTLHVIHEEHHVGRYRCIIAVQPHRL